MLMPLESIKEILGLEKRPAKPETKICCATFDDVAQLKTAVKAIRAQGYTQIEVYSPYPLHGIDEVLGYKRSPLGIFPLLGGFTGFSLGMLMSWWMGAVDYPLIVAGMPYFSWVLTFPIAYELTILLAAFGTLFGMFYLNRLPRPHHPIFDHPNWAQYTNDKLLLAIADSDPQYDEGSLRQILEKQGGLEIQTVAVT